MSVELTIETVEETIVLELQDHVPAVLTIDHIPELRDELDSKVDKEVGMGLSELSFTTVDKLSLDQSEQDRHTHSNKTVIDDLSDDSGVLQYKGLPISDQAALDDKVDKVAGYSLVDDDEIAKLATVQENATANRDDSLNADKVHDHVISDINDLTAKLELINQWLQVPADKKYFDFVGNRYSANGVPAAVSSLGTFTRLSTATQWKDGVLVDVAANVMRLDKAKGLLIEPQRTNYFLYSFFNGGNLTGFNISGGEYTLHDGVVIGGTSKQIRVQPPPYAARPFFYSRDFPALINHKTSYLIDLNGDIRPAVAEVSGKNDLYLAGTAGSVFNDFDGSKYTRVGANKAGLIAPSSTINSLGSVVNIHAAQVEEREVGSEKYSSWIPTTSAPVTRSKETLVVPFTSGQTVTADKDAGVTMTITGLNAVFEGHGYIRNVRVN